MALPANLLEVTQADLDQLVASAVREGPHLDFKRDLPTNWDNATKHEFLADITAFANAGGGDVVYGVDEDGEAQASAVVPQTVNVDQEVRRLQDFLLSLVEPRLPGVQIHAVSVVVNGTIGSAVVIRIPQSWAGPHRVKTNQHFFVRDGLRKRQLDVPEIRSLFLRSENQAQRVRDFRTDRLGKLLAGEAPHKLAIGPMLVAHLVPIQAALGLVQVDPVVFATQRRMPVLGVMGGMARLNVDGALAVRNANAEGATHGYSQFFRNGFFESVMVFVRREQQARAVLPSLNYERQLIQLLNEFRIELTHLGIDNEMAILLSLLRADELQLGVANAWQFADEHQSLFDRKTVALPDVLVRADLTAEQGLKPVFDLVWQAAGFNGSRNYNEAGDWAPRA